MARKDQLNCTTKGREVQFADVVRMVPLNVRPEGLAQRVYHQHGMSTPGSEAKGAFMSDTRSAEDSKGVSNPRDAGDADHHTRGPGGTSDPLVP